MISFDLPKSLEVGGSEYTIRSDFRDILTIISAFEDPDLEDADKQFICLYGLYKDFEQMPESQYLEAYEKAMAFIDHGNDQRRGVAEPKTMDWEQDANMIFPAVNKVAGFEVRSVEYLHWWTFTGYFMEIRDTVYSTVLSIRSKRVKGKKLEKWEKDFIRENKDLFSLRRKLSEEEKKDREEFLSQFK